MVRTAVSIKTSEALELLLIGAGEFAPEFWWNCSKLGDFFQDQNKFLRV